MNSSCLKEIIISLLILSPAFGAFEWEFLSPGSRAQGCLMLQSAPTPLSITHDPAALGLAFPPQVEMAWARPYQIKLLKATQFGIQSRMAGWGLAGSVHQFGRRDYQERKVNLAVGRRLSATVAGGLTATLYSLRIQNYGHSTALGWTAALHGELQPGLLWGVIIQNMTGARLNVHPSIPEVVTTGFRLQLLKLDLGLEWEQDLDYPGSLKFGVEYRPTSFLKIRIGANQRPTRIAGGFALLYRGLHIDYAVDYCTDLARITTDIGLVLPLGWDRFRANP